MVRQEIIVNRLALIKQLFKIGIEQSKLPEPTSAFSILSFHDSIEMFLKLLAEHKDIKTEKFAFIEYWTHIPTLTLKESLANLNTRRVNIKHKGLLPSKGDIEFSRMATTDFFDQNTIKYFEIEFRDISLIALIDQPSVRELLSKSQHAINIGNAEESILKASLAYSELLSSYEENKSHLGFRSFFSLVHLSVSKDPLR